MKRPTVPEMMFSPSDERALYERVLETAERLFGSGIAVQSIVPRPSEYASWYASLIVTVSMSDGRQFKIFLKNFGAFREPKNDMRGRRERELRTYRDLLAGANLGTADYYGSAWDESEGRYWLLLEFVEGTPVKYLNFENWVRAVGWLGRMHGRLFSRLDEFKEVDFLVRHDESFYQSVADRSMVAVSSHSPALTERLAPAVDRYRELIPVLVGPPITLLHGTYRSGQILIGPGGDSTRVCPTDWELAGLGTSFYDLAFLSDGFREAERHQMLETYRVEASRSGLPIPSLDEVGYAVDCFRLYRAMNWLAKFSERAEDESEFIEHLARAEQLAGSLPR